MSCAGRVDQYGNTAHLHERDTTIAVVSRAPIEKIERWKHKMGWTFPWYSSYGSRFNFDYGVSFDDTVDDPHYNYRSAAELQAKYGWATPESAIRNECVPSRRTSRLPHLLDLRARHRAGWRHALLPRHDGTWPPGGLGRAQRPRGIPWTARRPEASTSRLGCLTEHRYDGPSRRRADASEATTATCSTSCLTQPTRRLLAHRRLRDVDRTRETQDHRGLPQRRGRPRAQSGSRQASAHRRSRYRG